MMNTNISFLDRTFCNSDDDLSGIVPKSLLHGIGGFGKFIVSAFLKLKINRKFPLVLATQYGNVRQLAKMGQQILYENFCSPLLCSKFPNSVPAGVISIITKNYEKYTTVSAGSRSFEMGLLEALLSLREDIIYIYAEDDISGVLVDDNLPRFGAFALRIQKNDQGEFCVKNNFNTSAKPLSLQNFIDFVDSGEKKFEAANFIIERRKANG